MKANIICTAIWAGVILSFISYSNVMLTAPYDRLNQ